MKKSEKVLLAVVIGIAVILVATQLPGKGGSRAPEETQSLAPAQPVRAPAALELLAMGQVTFKAMPDGVRNLFRPVPGAIVQPQTHIAIKIEAIFGEADALSALLKGEVVRDGEARDDMTIVSLPADDPGLDVLIKGKLVRAGGRIGSLAVERVTRRGVVLEYRGERVFVTLYTLGSEPGETQ